MNRAKGKKRKVSHGKILSTRGNSRRYCGRREHPLLLPFLFLAAFLPWVRYRREGKSSRVFCEHLHRVFTFSLLLFVTVLKHFAFAHLKHNGKWFSQQMHDNCACFTKNQLTTFTLTCNRAKVYSHVFFLHCLTILVTK